jgi:ABC-2 type transport system permease protein
MWLLGGTFFSVKHFPEWLRPFVDVLPLTLFNDGLREAMRGGPIAHALVPLLVLAALALGCWALAVKVFRWV